MKYKSYKNINRATTASQGKFYPPFSYLEGFIR